jgi:CRP-like cAMP-binding protein
MIELIELSDTRISLQRNEFLKVKGSVDTNVYFVESGSLRVFVLDDCEEQIVRFGYRDNLIAALDSFLTGQPSDFYIQAIKKTVVRVITRKQVDEFLSDETNRGRWIAILESLVKQQLEREIDILTGSPRERYLRVLHRSPQLFQEVPLRYIANYLRMSPETLSRLRRRVHPADGERRQ